MGTDQTDRRYAMTDCKSSENINRYLKMMYWNICNESVDYLSYNVYLIAKTSLQLGTGKYKNHKYWYTLAIQNTYLNQSKNIIIAITSILKQYRVTK